MSTMKKLTLKSLKMNRSRTIVTIIGIALSVALITVIACMISSTYQTIINHSIQSTGNYDIAFRGYFTDEDVEKITSHRDIEAAYKTLTYGYAHNNNAKSAYYSNYEIFGIQKEGFTDCFGGKLKEGRFPDNKDEILISSHLNKLCKEEYKIGDMMELDIGASHIKNPDGTDFRFFQYIESDDVDITYEVYEKKSFKIVGIYDYLAGEVTDHSDYQMVYTIADYSFFSEKLREIGEPYRSLYVRLKPESESSFCNVIAEISGMDYSEAKSIWKDEQSFMRMLSESNMDDNLPKYDQNILYINPNYYLLNAKLITSDPKEIALYTSIVSVLFLIVMVSSMFIIRNSFAISITEKTKLYGMLSSVGATPRQIRRNVYFEGFMLGIFGIPLGVLIGVGTTFFLTKICGNLLYSLLNGVNIAFSVSFLAIVIAVLLGAGTIFLSVMSPANRASHISPIEAIRSNKDIKIGKRNKEKSYKTPKLITKLFGMGGSIAWKNLKRSKKKYRATVVSIVVSIAVFLTVSSFVGYVFSYTSTYFTGEKSDIVISDFYYTIEKDDHFGECIKDYKAIANFDNVENKIYYFSGYTGQTIELDPSVLTDEIKNYKRTDIYDTGFNEEKIYADMSIFAFDDDTYRMICEKAGTTPEKMKNQAVLLNCNTGYIYDEKGNQTESRLCRLIKEPVGMKLKMTVSEENYPYISDEADDYEKEIYEKEKAIMNKINNTPVIIGAEVSDMSFLISFEKNMNFKPSGILAVSKEWLFDTFGDTYVNISDLYLRTSDSYGVEEKAREYFDNKEPSPDSYIITNYVKMKNQMDSLALVIQIFVYGFIAVISLIGITNIFNTITANMKLRSKEFAMLRSVGMTGKEFDRMIALESIFYTFKSLIIGVPLGLLGSLLIYLLFRNIQPNAMISYLFPWQALLISFAVVLIIVWTIMMFSIRKVRRQNIIETIRNDNI